MTTSHRAPTPSGTANACNRLASIDLSDVLKVPGLDGLVPGDAPRDAFNGIWRRLCSFVIENPTAFAFLETRRVVRRGSPDLLVAQVYGGLVGVVRALRERSIELPADLADQTIDGAWNLLARTSTPSESPTFTRSTS